MFIQIAINHAQVSVTGKVITSSGWAFQGAVQIVQNHDTLISYCDTSGSFNFKGVQLDRFCISIRQFGAGTYNKCYLKSDIQSSTFILPTIQLKDNLLDEVVIKSASIIIKEDTVEYKASAIHVRDGSQVDELLRKIPGVTIDANGNISINGSLVTGLKVNGKDFLSGDIQTAISNLPADIISNIQVIDDYGDEAGFTKNKSGRPRKVINLNLRKDKSKGIVGKIGLGLGSDSKYLGNLSVNKLDDKNQLSVFSSINNTGLNLNLSPTANIGQVNNPSLLSDPNAGIIHSKSAAVNFRNTISDKVTVFGSYKLSYREKFSDGNSYQEDFSTITPTTTNRSFSNYSKALSNSINLNVEYHVDSNNFLKLTADGMTSNLASTSASYAVITRGRLITNTNYDSKSSGTRNTSNGSILYNHAFRRTKSNLTVNISNRNDSYPQKTELENVYSSVDSTNLQPIWTTLRQLQEQDNKISSKSSSISVSYFQPISKSLSVDLSYRYQADKNVATRSTYDMDTINTESKTLDTASSYAYTNKFRYNTLAANFNWSKNFLNISIGTAIQSLEQTGYIDGNSLTGPKTWSWLPNARINYRISKTNSFAIQYDGRNRQPDILKMRPVADSSDLNNIIVGNPNLKPEFLNNLSISYSGYDHDSKNIIFANLNYTWIFNQIAEVTAIDPNSASRVTSYTNSNGSYALTANVSYTKSIWNRRLTASVNSAGSLINNIFFNNDQRSTARSYNISPSAKLRLDIPDRFESELSSTYIANGAMTAHEATGDRVNSKMLSLNLSSVVYLLKNSAVGFSFCKFTHLSLAGSPDQPNPNIFNMFVEYRLLKDKIGSFKIQALDLLNQNAITYQTASPNLITSAHYLQIQRFFLFSFELKLRKFAER